MFVQDDELSDARLPFLIRELDRHFGDMRVIRQVTG
jgi:hypothetical protein